jgi:NDP-sugar pyrophosphorylase family protein
LVAPGRLSLTHPADLLAINLLYLEHGPQAVIEIPLPPSVSIVPPVRIEAGVQVGAGCTLGPRLYLERGCQIGPGAKLRDAVVLRDGVVSPRQTVTDRVIAGI